MIQFFYVASPNSYQIYVWKLDSDLEKMELIQVVSTDGCAQPMVIHTNRHFLYVGIRPNFRIDTYYINAEGLLNQIESTKIFISPTHLTINNFGTYLYCASYNYNAASVISINNSGVPGKSVQIIKNLLGCHSANIDPNNKFLWVPCLKSDIIKLFYFNKNNGKLILYTQITIKNKTQSGPRHMTFHNSGNYAYVINELNGTINVILLYPKKKSIPIIIQTINILPQCNLNIKNFWSSDIHITPDNRWLYSSDRSFNTISCFKVSLNTKKLQFINYQYTEKQPRGFTIDITGNFLVIAGQQSNYISLYRINTHTGQLHLISRHQSGTGPMWISTISCL